MQRWRVDGAHGAGPIINDSPTGENCVSAHMAPAYSYCSQGRFEICLKAGGRIVTESGFVDALE